MYVLRDKFMSKAEHGLVDGVLEKGGWVFWEFFLPFDGLNGRGYVSGR